MNRKNEQTKVPVSSLIDVVFLLIMFFVVTSVISDTAGIPVDLTQAQNMKPNGTPHNRVDLTIQEDGSVYIDSGRVPYTEQALINNLKSKVTRRGSGIVAKVRADKLTRHEEVERVMKAIKESGISKIKIMAELKGK